MNINKQSSRTSATRASAASARRAPAALTDSKEHPALARARLVLGLAPAGSPSPRRRVGGWAFAWMVRVAVLAALSSIFAAHQVSAATLTISSPSGGASITAGGELNVRWALASAGTSDTTFNAIAYLNVSVASDGVNFVNFATGLARSTTSAKYAVPAALRTTTAKARVRGMDKDGYIKVESVSSSFSVVAPASTGTSSGGASSGSTNPTATPASSPSAPMLTYGPTLSASAPGPELTSAPTVAFTHATSSIRINVAVRDTANNELRAAYAGGTGSFAIPASALLANHNYVVAVDAEANSRTSPEVLGYFRMASPPPAIITPTVPVTSTGTANTNTGSDGAVVIELSTQNTTDVWSTNIFNYGGSQAGGVDDERIRIGGWGDTYAGVLRFDLVSIPANARSVKLRLHVLSDENKTTAVTVHRVTNPWTIEGGRLAWAKFPAVDAAFATISAPQWNTFIELDISALVADWRSGRYPAHGIAFKPVNTDHAFTTFASSSHPEVSKRPKLIITPAAAISPTTATSTITVLNPPTLVLGGAFSMNLPGPLNTTAPTVSASNIAAGATLFVQVREQGTPVTVVANSGGITGTSWPIPSSALVAGKAYVAAAWLEVAGRSSAESLIFFKMAAPATTPTQVVAPTTSTTTTSINVPATTPTTGGTVSGATQTSNVPLTFSHTTPSPVTANAVPALITVTGSTLSADAGETIRVNGRITATDGRGVGGVDLRSADWFAGTPRSVGVTAADGSFSASYPTAGLLAGSRVVVLSVAGNPTIKAALVFDVRPKPEQTFGFCGPLTWAPGKVDLWSSDHAVLPRTEGTGLAMLSDSELRAKSIEIAKRGACVVLDTAAHVLTSGDAPLLLIEGIGCAATDGLACPILVAHLRKLGPEVALKAALKAIAISSDRIARDAALTQRVFELIEQSATVKSMVRIARDAGLRPAAWVDAHPDEFLKSLVETGKTLVEIVHDDEGNVREIHLGASYVGGDGIGVSLIVARPRIVGLAVRGEVAPGSNNLINGFGTSSGGRITLLAQVNGPALAPFGITNPLLLPFLQLFSGTKLLDSASTGMGVFSSDVMAARASTGAFATTTTAGSAAILRTLDGGSYTTPLGTLGQSGVALLEVYDVSRSSSRLQNLSTRGQVKPGSPLIGALSIVGPNTLSLVVRACGDSLANFGVAGPLSNPRLRIIEQSTGREIGGNDDWGSNAAVGRALPKVGAFSAALMSPRDAATVVSLGAGNYSLVAESSDGRGTGIVLLEIYELP